MSSGFLTFFWNIFLRAAIEIQAISWAADASDRVAVINNQVLGQGETIKEYQLVEIQKDQFILHHNGQKY